MASLDKLEGSITGVQLAAEALRALGSTHPSILRVCADLDLARSGLRNFVREELADRARAGGPTQVAIPSKNIVDVAGLVGGTFFPASWFVGPKRELVRLADVVAVYGVAGEYGFTLDFAMRTGQREIVPFDTLEAMQEWHQKVITALGASKE